MRELDADALMFFDPHMDILPLYQLEACCNGDFTLEGNHATIHLCICF